MNQLDEADAPLDPVAKLYDLARLEARLADPFVDRNLVFAEVGSSSEQHQIALTKWRAELASKPNLLKLFMECFRRERERLQGAVRSDRTAPDATAIGGVASLGPALPFVPGSFAPQPLAPPPQATSRERSFDPDATALPSVYQAPVLPFDRERGGKSRGE
jgi:hypothetical protein